MKAMPQIDTVCDNSSWWVNKKNVLSPHAKTKVAFGHQPRRRPLCTRLRYQYAFQPATTASAVSYWSTVFSTSYVSFLPSTAHRRDCTGGSLQSRIQIIFAPACVRWHPSVRWHRGAQKKSRKKYLKKHSPPVPSHA